MLSDGKHCRGVEEPSRPRWPHKPEIAGANPAAPTLDALPEAKAEPESVGTDKAEPLQGLGTGNTLVARNATTAEPMAWAVVIPLSDGRYAVDDFFLSRANADQACEWRMENTPRGAKVIPVYGHPQPEENLREENERLRERIRAIADAALMSRQGDAPADQCATQPRNGAVDKPVAWAALRDDGDIAWIGYTPDGAADGACGRRIVPLYRQPPCQVFLRKNLTLTAAEREAVEKAIGWIESPGVEDEAMPEDYLPITAALRGLLERMK